MSLEYMLVRDTTNPLNPVMIYDSDKLRFYLSKVAEMQEEVKDVTFLSGNPKDTKLGYTEVDDLIVNHYRKERFKDYPFGVTVTDIIYKNIFYRINIVDSDVISVSNTNYSTYLQINDTPINILHMEEAYKVPARRYIHRTKAIGFVNAVGILDGTDTLLLHIGDNFYELWSNAVGRAYYTLSYLDSKYGAIQFKNKPTGNTYLNYSENFYTAYKENNVEVVKGVTYDIGDIWKLDKLHYRRMIFLGTQVDYKGGKK